MMLLGEILLFIGAVLIEESSALFSQRQSVDV